jgi:CMP-2-keto-3-deoxyoctulosonic acid synthetase
MQYIAIQYTICSAGTNVFGDIPHFAIQKTSTQLTFVSSTEFCLAPDPKTDSILVKCVIDSSVTLIFARSHVPMDFCSVSIAGVCEHITHMLFQGIGWLGLQYA